MPWSAGACAACVHDRCNDPRERRAPGKLSQPGGDFFGIHASNDGRVMIPAGGVAPKRDGKVVGAIGVSGGAGKQDQAVAAAGAAAF